MASQCCDFIANVKGSGVAHSFLETEFNQIKRFHLKANIDLVTMKGKSATYLNKHLIPEIQFPWTVLIIQRRRKMVLSLPFPNKKGYWEPFWAGASLLGLLIVEALYPLLSSELSALRQAFPVENGNSAVTSPFQPDTSVTARNSPKLLSYSSLFPLAMGWIWVSCPAVKFTAN